MSYSISGQPVLNGIQARLPSWAAIWKVFAVIAFFIHLWSLHVFIYTFPALLNYLTAIEILVVLAYVLSVDLFESLLGVGLLVVLSAILPKNLLRNYFVSQGSLIACILIFWLIFLHLVWNQWTVFTTFPGLLQTLLGIAIAYLIVIPLFTTYMLHRSVRFQLLLDEFAERLTVSAFIFSALDIIALCAIIIRNLIG